jgi:uncharacterized protein (TIGR00159 family)
MNYGVDILLANIAQIGSATNIARSFYVADFFDVLIIALLIYTAILLFRQTRSFLILAGIAIVIGIYVVAQIFNLYLTVLVLQSFFGVFLVVLVVVFQDELRRFFELVAVFGTRERKVQPLIASSPAMDEIIQAVAHMAHEKIGALIVVHGRENIDRLVEGGVTLDGVISEEVIVSIFDPTSSGHDGAMVINRNRVETFGGHLPLSNNFKEIGKHGTRHSAALGLAERSDALAIAVSEEQGTISIARDGRLRIVENIDQLTLELDAFLQEKFFEGSRGFVRNIVQKNLAQKIFSLVAALVIWFLVAFQAGTVQRDFALPVTYRNLPDAYIVEDSLPKTITVTLEGRGQNAFDRVDASSLELAIDASTVKQGSNAIRITGDLVKRPLSLSVVNMDPSVIRLDVEKFSTQSVPIRVRTTGSPASGYKIMGATVMPSSATLLVPEGMRAPDTILTEPISINGVQESFMANPHIIVPQGMRLKKEDDGTVVVSFAIEQ